MVDSRMCNSRMYRHVHTGMSGCTEDRIASRWGEVLSEEPISSMRFTSPYDRTGPDNRTLTVVYHHKRFVSETQRLNFLLNYDFEARDAILQPNNNKVEKGWFVRPPALQPTTEHLGEMTTLQEQVSTIWPNMFYPMYEDHYFLKMIMKVPISGPTSRIVHHQEVESEYRQDNEDHQETNKTYRAPSRQGLEWFGSLDTYLTKTKHSRPGHEDFRLFSYETMVDIPTPESKTIMQIYVSGGSTTNLEFIPLLDYLDNSITGRHKN